MADATTTGQDAAAQRAAEQARQRKERREAKIKAGGSARLNKITGLGGGVPRDAEPTPAPAASPPAPTADLAPAATITAASPPAHADPEEVDISDHYYEPKKAEARAAADPMLSEDQLRQMMLGFERNGSNTPGQGTPGPNLDEDPIMKMMSQLMGGAGFPGAEPGSSPFPGFSGLMPESQTTPATSDPYTSLWRILHALVALGLGLYIILLTPFSGSKIERERAASMVSIDPLAEDEHEQRKRLFFWTFATAEAVLLTTRFFLDKGRAPPSGIVWTVVGLLPEPFKGYVSIVLRYGQIFTTVRADMLACIFVLGLCAWWRG